MRFLGTLTIPVIQTLPLAEGSPQPDVGAIFYEIDSAKFWGFNGTVWVDFAEALPTGSGITRSVNVTAGNYSAGSTASTDYVYLVAGLHTGTLPTAVGNLNRYTVKNNHTANITMGTTSSQTIDGTLTISLSPQSSVDLISTGSNWSII